ncbi:hypothetical protein BCU97_11405 [Vibrio splendidus]|nr:hypothetical protein BCU97_11405 [Vibrio splendidus]
MCSILLSDYLVFEALLWAQVAVYTIGVLGCILPKRLLNKPISLISYLIVGHYANFIGGIRYLIGLENSPWTRANH